MASKATLTLVLALFLFPNLLHFSLATAHEARTTISCRRILQTGPPAVDLQKILALCSSSDGPVNSTPAFKPRSLTCGTLQKFLHSQEFKSCFCSLEGTIQKELSMFGCGPVAASATNFQCP